MWPLLGLSILAVAVLVDRLIAFSLSRSDLRGLLARIGPSAKSGRWDDVRQQLHPRSPLDQIVSIYLDHFNSPREIRDDIVRREGVLLLDQLGKRVHWLTAIGQLSPMLGLLGTVTGLVAAFHQVELRGGQVQPADLASGIWEALLTTVFGLVVAIPALAGRHIFQQRLDARAQDFALLVTYLDEWRLATKPRDGHPVTREGSRKAARHA
jgi:biopolymer transport protein ExbB